MNEPGPYAELRKALIKQGRLVVPEEYAGFMDPLDFQKLPGELQALVPAQSRHVQTAVGRSCDKLLAA